MPRPKKKQDEARNRLMQIRLQASEYESYKQAAEIAGLDLSGWVRTKLREAAMRGDVPGLVKASW